MPLPAVMPPGGRTTACDFTPACDYAADRPALGFTQAGPRALPMPGVPAHPPKCLLLTIAPVSSNVSQSKPYSGPVGLRCGFGQTNLAQTRPHGYAL